MHQIYQEEEEANGKASVFFSSLWSRLLGHRGRRGIISHHVSNLEKGALFVFFPEVLSYLSSTHEYFIQRKDF